MKIKLKHQAVLANKKDFLSPSDRAGERMGALNPQENSFSLYSSLLAQADTGCGRHKVRTPCWSCRAAFPAHFPVHFPITWHDCSQAKGEELPGPMQRKGSTLRTGELLQDILHGIIRNSRDGRFKGLSHSFRRQGEAVCRGISGPYTRRRHQF